LPDAKTAKGTFPRGKKPLAFQSYSEHAGCRRGFQRGLVYTGGTMVTLVLPLAI
jgi:hypothetical protein